MSYYCFRIFRSTRLIQIVLLLSNGSILAQPSQLRSPMVSDRPGAYCGAQTVGKGVFHIETGFSYDRTAEASVRLEGWFFPMVFRVGLIPDLELRLKTAGPGHARAAIGDLSQTESGFSSPVVEVKWKFLDLEETRLALLFSADLEAGTKAFRPHKNQPGINFASDFSLGDSYSLNTNLGVISASDPDTQTRFAQPFYTVALWRSLSSEASVFIETFGTYPHEKEGQWQNLVNGGLAYLVNDDLQLDVSLARGLTHETSDWTFATGISLRLY